MQEKSFCPICGQPTSSYMGKYRQDKLCKKHAADLKSGKLSFCKKCNTLHYVDAPCSTQEPEPIYLPFDGPSIEQQRQADGKCIVCGKNAPKGSLCRDCYYEMLDYKDTFDKNAKAFELKDYYFNLRSNIYRMKNFSYVQSNCNKLMALAVLTKDLYADESLTSRIVTDIKEIIEKKQPKAIQTTSEDSKTQDARKEELLRTADGHYVKSYPEVTVDDILYEARIVHCYEKRVPINDDEQTIVADWFIPVRDNRHGIYIEYWGMNTKDYLKNKERKQKAYKDHDIPLIEIEKDDDKDKHGLSDRIISEINKLAEKYFHIKDFV